MTIKLYELTGAEDDRRFSPNVWRIRLALRHKGLEWEGIAWRFTEKDQIAFTGQGRVPVIVDGEKHVHDSWAIAEYLEENYPERPSLFGGQVGKAHARFVTDWAEIVVGAGIFPMVVLDIHNHAHEKDRAYFRASREKMLGRTLEEAGADRDKRVLDFRQSLTPLRRMLTRQPFFGGASPAWGDMAVFGLFQWARCISPFQLLLPDDSVHAWRERMLDAYGAEARKVKAYAS